MFYEIVGPRVSNRAIVNIDGASARNVKNAGQVAATTCEHVSTLTRNRSG